MPLRIIRARPANLYKFAIDIQRYAGRKYLRIFVGSTLIILFWV